MTALPRRGDRAGRPAPLRRSWRARLRSRRVSWHVRLARRVLAALCLGLAVAGALRLAFPAPPPAGTRVVSAARDLPAGHVLDAKDLVIRRWPGSDAPTTWPDAEALVGRRLAGPVATGDPLTPRAVTGAARLAGLPEGSVALAVPSVEPVVADLVRAGDRVQVWAGARLVAPAAVVLQTPVGESAGVGLPGGASGASGRTVLVSLNASQSRALHAGHGAGPEDEPLHLMLTAGSQ